MEDSRTHMGTSSFTHNGDYFALLSVDGRLRIWDTTSGKIVQEFPPNSATQSSCTCLCWTRAAFNRGEKQKLKRKKKKKKKSGDAVVFPSLAIGTDKGFVFCYNPTTGEIEKLNKDGHIDKVNCVTYEENEDVIYTCSDDKYILQWCAKDHQIKSKWKADKRAVKRICVGPSGTTLLSAGRSIKLWDLETKELLQKFQGHSSPVSLLQFSPYKQNAKGGSGDDGCYFVSGSTEDRVINAWQVNTKNPEIMAVASFIISDVAVFMDIILDEDDDQPLKLCVGCKDGRIHFFTCTMNGRTSKPIESAKTVDYLMKEGASTSPIPLINAKFHKSNEVNLNLVSGQSLNLSFTSLCYGELEVTTRIEKDIKKNLLLSEIVKENDTSIELATTNCTTKFISDTNSLPLPKVGKIPKVGKRAKRTPVVAVGMNGDLQTTEGVDELSRTTEGVKTEVNKHSQATDGVDNELSMEERIKLTLTEPNSKDFVVKMKPTKAAPNAGSFAQMLIQALHSNDDKLITELLFNNNFPPKVLTNTVKRIPNTLVETLLRTLTDKLLWNPNRSTYLIQWLRTIMSVHLTFLLMSDVSKDALAGLYRLVKTQEEIHLPLLSLQGKIDMICSYVSGSNVDDGEDDDLSTAAAVVYDDSSDETEEVWGKDRKTDKEIKEIVDSDASEDDTERLKIDSDENNESDIDIDTDEAIAEDDESEDEV